MNYFDDLRIVSCGYSRDPGLLKIQRAGNRDREGIPCPVSGKPCFAGWAGRNSINDLLQ